MSPPDHILVVDDDPEIRRLLAQQLERQGLRVSTAAQDREFWAVLAQSPVDLVVLDVMLPGTDGVALLQALRRGPHAAVPVIMLTALADDVDRVIGLEMGADDYVPKPFTPRELLARIRAVLRRVRMLPPGQAAQRLRYAHFGDWTLDLAERSLVHAGGTVTPLNGAEFGLLAFLLDHAQQVVTRDQLLVQLAGRDAEVFDRSIDLRVSRLRKRLGDDVREPGYVKTVRHEGYVLAREVLWSADPRRRVPA
ncbi:DNA-binding response regulator [Rubrivivax gelatinosus]|uniref:response regulator n=1 Tax=Rubrivivax gelatinosus TaxID=28068 RepID=UPI001904F289|nr:DNA-binding response regulator [Rubrivivax gelatinosus]